MKNHPAAPYVNLLGLIADGRRTLEALLGGKGIVATLWPMPEQTLPGVRVSVVLPGRPVLDFYEPTEDFPSDTLKAKIMLLA